MQPRGGNWSHSAGTQHGDDTYPWMLLLLLKADTLPQGHQMLLLSAVYSSDEQARAWGWEAAQDRECHGSLEGLLSSHGNKPSIGHKDWLSVTQPAPEREEIKKGRPEQ